MTEKPTMLITMEQRDWAFDRIAQQIMFHLANLYKFTAIPFGEFPQLEQKRFDAVFCLWWACFPWLDQRGLIADKVYIGLYDGFSWPDNPVFWNLIVKRADGFAVANDRIRKRLWDGLDHEDRMRLRIVTTMDGVDFDKFHQTPLPQDFTVGWAGNSQAGGNIKGFDLIRQAVKKTGVKLVVADSHSGVIIPHDQMCETFYKKINCYVCASAEGEGTPNPPLESLASGKPVITTQVGIMPEVIVPNYNGIFVGRYAGSIADAISSLVTDRVKLEALAHVARSSVESFRWEERVLHYRDLFGDAERRKFVVTGRFAADRGVYPNPDHVEVVEAVADDLLAQDVLPVRHGAKRWCRPGVASDADTVWGGFDGNLTVFPAVNDELVPWPDHTVIIPLMPDGWFERNDVRSALEGARVFTPFTPYAGQLEKRYPWMDVKPCVLPVRRLAVGQADVEARQLVRSGKHLWVYAGVINSQVVRFVNSWKKLYAPKHPDSLLWVYGSGGQPELFRGAGTAQFRFHAAADVENIGNVLSQATGFVNPLVEESWGSTVLDVIRLGCPVVTLGCKARAGKFHVPSMHGLAGYPFAVKTYKGGFGEWFRLMDEVEQIGRGEAWLKVGKFGTALAKRNLNLRILPVKAKCEDVLPDVPADGSDGHSGKPAVQIGAVDGGGVVGNECDCAGEVESPVACASTGGCSGGGKKRVLIVYDRPNWAFSRIAQQQARFLSDEFIVDRLSLLELPDVAVLDYDIVVLMWYAALADIKDKLDPHTAVIIAHYDAATWGVGTWEREQLVAGLKFTPYHMFANFNLFRIISSELGYAVREHQFGFCQDGVDTGLFRFSEYRTDLNDTPLRVGWAGSTNTDWRWADVKGVPLLHAAIDGIDGVELMMADRKDKWRPIEEMPEFYAGVDVVLCCSQEWIEGTPNMLLEAASCGRAWISTRTGIAPEVFSSGAIIVDRTVEAVQKELVRLRDNRHLLPAMGRANRAEMVRAWDWSIRAESLRELCRVVETEKGKAKSGEGAMVPVPSTPAPAPVSFKAVRKHCLIPDFARSYDLTEMLTVFVVTTGGINYSDVVEALHGQTARFAVREIKNIEPMSAAFQQMIDRCKTKYFVQVDDDMVLYPNAIATLFRMINETDDVAIACAGLWDVHLGRAIFGVKAYDADLIRKYTFTDGLSCDVGQMKKLQEDGGRVAVANVLHHVDPIHCGILGQHSPKWTLLGIYERYFSLAQKARFRPESMTWVHGAVGKILERFRRTGDVYDWYALSGAIAGMAADVVDQEKRFSEYDNLPGWALVRHFTGKTW